MIIKIINIKSIKNQKENFKYLLYFVKFKSLNIFKESSLKYILVLISCSI